MLTQSNPDPLASYREDLALRKDEGRLRSCKRVEPISALDGESMRVEVDGQSAINFSSNDYLGLTRDERLREAAIEAIRQYGTGSTASRLVCGTNALTQSLEASVAAFKHAEAALVFNSGYQANVSILQAILEAGDWVFCDKLNHASLMDGCLLSGARWSRYRHLDLQHLEDRLKKAPAQAKKWIVTDSVFSMDGDYPDLAALVEITERHGALVMVDEAHATGLYGATRNSGLVEQFGLSDRIALQMGTFSKALGGAGAYVAGSRLMVDTLTNKARGFIYSTAQPPAVIGTALKAVEVVQQDPGPKQRLWENVACFERLAKEAGLASRLSLPLQSAIVPVLIGDDRKTLQVSQTLLDAGYFAQGIRPPTVPPGTARLRIALSAAHTQPQLHGLVGALTRILN